MEAGAHDVGGDDTEATSGGGFGSLGSILFLLSLTWAAGIATFPLNDNSWFTHLATGRIILDRGAVPSADPYTFTAFGEPWTVQSWLASVYYAGAESLGGGIGLRAAILVVLVAAMVVLWRLTAPATSVVVRLLVLTAALFVCTDLWSERPYMIGVVGLGVLWLALEGTSRAWLLAPLGWVWANTHGSYLLGIGLVVLVALGRALDERSVGARPRLAAHDLRVAAWFAGGVVAGCVGPLGPKVLLFPLTALDKADVFAEILEWQAPRFVSVPERAFVVVAVLAIVGLVRIGRWSRTLPAVVFLAAALVAQRNVVMATMVLVPILAEAAPQLGSLRIGDRPALGRPIAVLAVVPLVLTAVVAILSPVTGLGGYPSRALAFVDGRADGPIAGELFTGNLLEVLDGPTGTVFADDRVDMLPVEVFEDYLELSRGAPRWREVLDDYEIDLVVWARGAPVTALLVADAGWRVLYQDAGWSVSCRRTGSACP